MESFGRKMRDVMESRDLGVGELARETGLDVDQIEALRHDDLAALPDDERVTQALATFARLVDVSPDEVVADFLRQREQAAQPEIEVVQDRVVQDEPPAEERPDSRAVSTIPLPAGRLALVVIGLVAVAMAGMWLLAPSPPEDASPLPEVSPEAEPAAPGAGPVVPESEPTVPGAEPMAPEAQAAEPAAVAPERQADVPEVAAESPREALDTGTSGPGAVPAPSAGGLAVTAYGTGTGVSDHQLVGKASRFSEGDQVWFWTRVEGAEAGAAVRHVWLHEGREVLSVPLRIGGPRWRTQSYKIMHAGSAGSWAVEARDAEGRVLARQEFDCVSPAGR